MPVCTPRERAMASLPTIINDVPQAIQLALGPAFLLTAIAGLLNVMTGRLARIIDRGRYIAEQTLPADPQVRAALIDELPALEKRRRLAGSAITACTLAALMVCMVIAALFLEALLDVPLRGAVGLLFTAGTLAMVVGLASFVREVRLSTRTVRIPLPRSGP
jgi:hypothetical protein